jgi:hypothetical protein
VPDGVLARIRSADGIIDARLVELDGR